MWQGSGGRDNNYTATNKSSDLHSAAVHSGKWAGETWQQLDYLPQYLLIWKHYTYEELPAAPRGREGRVKGEGGGKKGIIVKMLNLFLACVMQSLRCLCCAAE